MSQILKKLMADNQPNEKNDVMKEFLVKLNIMQMNKFYPNSKRFLHHHSNQGRKNTGEETTEKAAVNVAIFKN